MIYHQSKKVVAILAMLLLPIVSSLCQEDEGLKGISEENAQREEIQRYFGYEDVLYRYITLPYDVSANVNQQGKFVDIGFALFALLPLVLLYFVYSKKRWFYSIMTFLLVYLSICFRFSFLLDKKMQTYNPITDDGVVNSELVRGDGAFLHPFYKMAGYVSKPLTNLMDKFTGPHDHVTYPIMVLCFLVVLYFIINSQRISQRLKFIGIAIFPFCFLWWILSGGIIWYGFLMIPMAYVLILHGINWKRNKNFDAALRTLSYSTIGTLGLWIFFSYTSRISNVNYHIPINTPEYGMQIVEPRIQPYALGMINKRQSLEVLAKNMSIALDIMNSDTSLILQIGSSLAFDIKRNNLRTFEDNSLSHFYGWVERYRTKERTTEFLKSHGFGYIILDLRLYTLDHTPEKSLTKKYNLFLLNFAKDNPRIKLIATDQMYTVDGRQYMGVYGEGRPSVFGSYAVFELL